MSKYKSTIWFVAALFIAFAVGCGSSESNSITDILAPTVTLVNSADLATDVAINTQITATFSEAMDPLSITALTFTIYQDVTAVEGTVAYTGTTATFTPTSDFEANTLYTATITVGAKDLAGNAMTNSYVWSFTTGAILDITAPTVTFVNPANNDTDVAFNMNIAATFSEAMDIQTVTADTFTLLNYTTPVAGTVTYIGTTATFSPTVDLEPSTEYTANIAVGALDLAGNALASDFEWSFTTGPDPDAIAPTVTGTLNANGATNVAINANIGATFSEVMDPLTITNVTFTVEAPLGTPVLGTVSYFGVSAVFLPLSTLAPDTLHTVTIKGGVNGVKDLAGNLMEVDFVLSWTTGSALDVIAPTVTGTISANGATGVSINTSVGATFSKGMYAASITNVTFKLEAPVGTAVHGTVTYAGVSAVFVPLSTLEPNTLYTCTVKGGINGVKDIAGNAMASDFVWSWTTGDAADVIAPTVTNTIHVNGAIGVAINTNVGATFSEGMAPLTITTLTFMVEAPVGTPVLGVVSYTGVNAVFDPLSDLASSTLYTVTIKGGVNGVKDLAGNPMASDFVMSWTTGAAADITAPTVTGTLHANGATNVAINTNSGATFSEGMDPLTITTLTFLVEAPVGTPVLGVISYTGVNAIFNPSSDLAPSTLHTVTMKGGVNGVKDLAGNPMASDFVLSWTTSAAADITAPTILLTINADGATNVPVNTNVNATFSEGMDPLTLTTLTFIVEAPVGTPVLGVVSYSGVNAIFNPSSDLAPSTLHTVTMKGGVNGVKDLAGNPMASDYVWSWTTGLTPDIIAPTVSLVSPLNLATDVPTNTTVVATFSEPMDPLTITTVIFSVAGEAPVTGTIVYAGTSATFTPLSDLAASTLYTATITIGAKDVAGNPLEAEYIWSFTTGLAPVVLNAVVLGQTSSFAVLAGYAVTNTPPCIITGDVGVSPSAESFITGFSQTAATGYSTSPQVDGFIYAADSNPTIMTPAKGDLTIAYNDAKDRTPIPTDTFLNPGVGNLAGLALVPGLYKFTGDAIATANFSLTGGANDVWIFQIATALLISNDVQMTLGGSAQAKNVFWQVGTQATLGTYTTFHGTIMAEAAVTMSTGATLYGRAMAFTGTVALDQNTIVVPLP